MSRFRRNQQKFIGRLGRRSEETAFGIAPVTGFVEGTNPDGTIQVVRDGRDCKQPGDVRGASDGDGVVLGPQERRDGIASASPQLRISTGNALPPEVTEADPELWAGGDVTLRGRNLAGVQSVGLRLPSPQADVAYPGVVVEAITPDTETAMTITVSVDLNAVPVPELRGGIAVDNEDTDKPRYLTEDLFVPGEPEILSIEPSVLWAAGLEPPGEGSVITVVCTGVGLGAIDAVDFGLPSGPGDQRWQSQQVVATTGTTITVELTVGDEFLPALDPWPIDFGIGGLQYVSAPLWTAHAPVVPVEAWLLYVEDRTVGGDTLPKGLYAYPQPHDPSQEGFVPLQGRVRELPAALPTAYSPSGPASAAGYQGRLAAEWYGGEAGRMLIGQRGDALPDGGAGTGQSYGTGTGVWWVVWDVLDDVLHAPVVWPTENRMIGPVIDVTPGRVHGITYLSGSGARLASSDIDGTDASVGSRVFGSPPHELLAFDGGTMTASTWNPSLGTPSTAQKWPVGGSGRAIVLYTTTDNLTSVWEREARATAARPGDNLRYATRFGNVQAYEVTVGASVTDADGYPNVSFSALSNRTPVVDAGVGVAQGDVATGTVVGAEPSGGRVLIAQIDGSTLGIVAREVEAKTTTETDLTVTAQIPMGDHLLPPVAQAAFPASILPDEALP
jgi:hypothetical protein